jgi:hypothetical protein
MFELKQNSTIVLKGGGCLIVREIQKHSDPLLSFILICTCEEYFSATKKIFIGFSTWWFDTDYDNMEFKSITCKSVDRKIRIIEIERIIQPK